MQKSVRVVAYATAALLAVVIGVSAFVQLQPASPHQRSASFGKPAVGAPLGVTLPPGTIAQFDDVTLSLIPGWAQAVAGYVSGSFANYFRLAGDFPHAYRVSIATNAGASAECLDVEPGDGTPGEAPGWVRWMLSLHHWKPCIYSSWSEFFQVRVALGAAGISRSQVREWDADWTGCPHLDSGFDGTQCTDTALGRSLDESTMTRGFYNLPSVTKPKPKPKPVVKPKPAPSALQKERATVQHLLILYGCRRRVRQHQSLGPWCRAEFAKGRAIDKQLHIS